MSYCCYAIIHRYKNAVYDPRKALRLLSHCLKQGCPTCGPLDMPVRPFSLLSSLLPFLRTGKFFERGKFSWEDKKNLEGDRLLASIGGKMNFPKKKGHEKKMWDM